MMELKALQKNFCKPESHLAISETVNDKLTEQLVLVQKKCWEKGQYSRR